MRVTVDDIRKAGHCIGLPTKRWFREYGLDYRDFLKNGIEAERLLATGDGIAARVVRLKCEREGVTDG